MLRGLIIIMCLLFLVLFSCKNKQRSDADESEATIEINTEKESETDMIKDEKSGDCEDFIDDYEEWMDNYITLIAKYKDDPVSLARSEEYISMSAEMMNWTTRWSEVAMDCASNPDFDSRFNEIQEKADKEMEALGLR